MIAGILAPSGSGGTFFDWTLHYLAGDHDHITLRSLNECDGIIQKSLVPVPSNPLQGLTAHQHKKTHPGTIAELSTFFDYFRLETPHRLHSFYFCDRMGIGIDHTCHRDIVVNNPAVKFFSFAFDEQAVDQLFCLQIEKVPGHWNRLVNEIVFNGRATEHIPLWEKREIMSLYYPNCVRNQTVSETIGFIDNHRYIDWQDFLFRFDSKVLDVTDWLKIDVNAQRLSNWIGVYKKWQDSLSNDFFVCISQILTSMVQNLDYDLSRFKMTTAKEIVLESLLLRRHNLSVRSHGLESLPLNTKHWHDLLEPNIYHAI